MKQKKPNFPLSVNLGQRHTLVTCNDAVAVYQNPDDQACVIFYRGEALDKSKQDTVSIIRPSKTHDDILSEVTACGYRIDNGNLPLANRFHNGMWYFLVGGILSPLKTKSKAHRTNFPKTITRDSDGKEFYTLSVDGDTALYTSKDRTAYRLAVRHDANIMVSGITFKDNHAYIGMGSEHFLSLQEVLNSLGYTYTVTGSRAIGHTIDITRINGYVHVFELLGNIAPTADLPCGSGFKLPENGEFALPSGQDVVHHNLGIKVGDLHCDTGDLVTDMMYKMIKELRVAELNHPDRPIAWKENNWEERCMEKLRDKLFTNSYPDAINYIMFAQYHGWDVSKAVNGISIEPPPRDALEVEWDDDADVKAAEDLKLAMAHGRGMNKIPHLTPGHPITITPADNVSMVYEFTDEKQRDDYRGLYSVLMDALDQACNGKGKERHANAKPFEAQPMQTHCDSLGSPQGMGYQVMKKTAEAMGMVEPERQIRELLGAINYAAGMIIWINRHNK